MKLHLMHNDQESIITINSIEDFQNLARSFPKIDEIVLHSTNLKEAGELVADYLSSGVWDAWIE